MRTGETAAALALASTLLADRFGRWRVELALVRLEAAHALGRMTPAFALTPRDRARLRALGHGAWLDRLATSGFDHG